MLRQIKLGVLALVWCTSLSPWTPVLAAGDHDDFYEMKVRGEEMWTVLESLPYASEGSGPVMYLLEYSQCPYCQRMYQDFGTKDTGMEQRKVFVPINEQTAREAAALGKSRRIADYHSFMRRQKVAPDFRQDNAAIDAINAVIAATNGPLEDILKQNQWPLDGISFPQYMWRENGRVFANAGYSKESFSKAIARNIAGNKSVGATTPAPNLATTRAPTSMAQRAPSLEENDIRGVHLQMTPQQVHQHLRSTGWRQQGLKWTKDDGSKQTLSVTLSPLLLPGEDIGRIEAITYTQQLNRETTILDLKAVKSALEEKYGQADKWGVSTPARKGGGASLDDPQGRLSMTFNEYQNVPKMSALTKVCKASLIRSGMSVLQANQRAAGTLYQPNGAMPPPPGALDATKKYCPEAIPQIMDIQKSMIAPVLSATAFRQGANITLQLSWGKPRYDYMQAQQNAQLRKQSQRRSSGKIDF